MGYNILVVEDNPVQMKLTCKVLGKVENYKLFQASNGSEARKRMKEGGIDLVLCDIGLPDESGLDLTRFITTTYKGVIVIMLTATEEVESSEKALENGALKFLVKPVKPQQLKISVSTALQLGEYQYLVKHQKAALEDKIVGLVKAKLELEKSEAEFKAIFDNIQEGFFRINTEEEIVLANPVFVRIAGYDSFEEIRGMKIVRLCEDRKVHELFVEKLKKSGHLSAYELNILRKDGSKGTILVNVYIRKDIRGQDLGIEGTILDISKRKHLEFELLQAQKLESIGQLAAGIAHEINTPIQYVGDNTNFLQDAFDDILGLVGPMRKFLENAKKGVINQESIEDIESLIEDADLEYLVEEVPGAIQQSLDGVGRVSKIVRSMKEFSHPGGEEMERTDINQAIENTVTVARNEWKYVAELTMELDEALPKIPCNIGEINQVVLNMIINASHAIADVLGEHPEGRGTITISTCKKDGFLQISIQDTGTGMPEKVKSKIFDPFFTTKKVGKGTGQGLAISHSVIVERHKGRIKVESEQGKGTCFIISLPMEQTRQEKS